MGDTVEQLRDENTRLRAERDDYRRALDAHGEHVDTVDRILAVLAERGPAEGDGSDVAQQVAALADERDRLRTWDGLMSVLDEHYPPHVIDGSSGDPGPRVLVLARALDRAGDERDEALVRAEQAERERDELRKRDTAGARLVGRLSEQLADALATIRTLRRMDAEPEREAPTRDEVLTKHQLHDPGCPVGGEDRCECFVRDNLETLVERGWLTVAC